MDSNGDRNEDVNGTWTSTVMRKYNDTDTRMFYTRQRRIIQLVLFWCAKNIHRAVMFWIISCCFDPFKMRFSTKVFQLSVPMRRNEYIPLYKKENVCRTNRCSSCVLAVCGSIRKRSIIYAYHIITVMIDSSSNGWVVCAVTPVNTR